MAIRTSPNAFDQPRLNLRKPADVVAAVPYLLGYHPRHSVVVLALDGKRLLFSIRDDLPATSGKRDVGGLVDHLRLAVLTRGATAVLAIGFGPPELVTPTVLALGEAYRKAGLAVRELLRVDGERFWSYLCEDPRCCPLDGTPYDLSTSSVAATATFAGCVVLADRRAYLDQVTPVTGGARLLMRQATQRATARLFDLITSAEHENAAGVALVAAGELAVLGALRRQRCGGRLDDDEVAWLSVLLATAEVWELAWARLDGPPPEVEVHRALWLDVMRRVEPDLLAAPGSLFAYAAWRRGEAVLARLAVERVLEAEPDNWLANEIGDALALGTPPPALPSRPATDLSRRSARLPRRRSSSRLARSRRR